MKQYTINDLHKQPFSLVLSGGSARGYSHLGVIKFLEENNLKPKEVVGTSMGSIIAAFLAVGKTYNELIEILNHTHFLKLISVKYGDGGFKQEKIRDFINELLNDKSMKDTLINLKICATNFRTGKAKIFTKDNDIKIADAVMASIAIPGVFSPKKIHNQYYVDGFLSSDLPIEFANQDLLKLAVNVENPKSIKDFKDDEKKIFHFNKTKHIFRNIKLTFAWMIVNQTYQKLEHIKNYILIEPNLLEYEKTDFTKFEEISNQGHIAIKQMFRK